MRRGKGQNINGDAQTVVFDVIHTYRYHCLGDYPDYIQRSGPSGNYSTQVVRITATYTLSIQSPTTLSQGELEHCHVKRFYARTNKVAHTMQITRQQRKRALLESIRRSDTSFTPRWE